MNPKRYSRQTILPEIGLEGQTRLSQARVLCIGAGGLGSPAALYLAAAGVGKIGIIDPDHVDVSNLQRQILFETSHQGEPKARMARERLRGINPEIQVEAHVEMFCAENAERVLAGYDLLLDGSDNFETKHLANDAAYKAGIPLVYAAVERFEGQVALFEARKGACYRCLYPEAPKAPVRNCAETGVLGSIVGTIGTLQATLVLQRIVSAGDPGHPLFAPPGRLTLLDLAGRWNISSVQIPKKPDCATCSREPSSITLRGEPATCSPIQAISAASLRALLDDPTSDLLLIDVRTAEEWSEGHLPRAMHWPLDRLERGDLPPRPSTPSSLIVVYCKSGVRSARAAELLKKAGMESTRNLLGGITSW